MGAVATVTTSTNQACAASLYRLDPESGRNLAALVTAAHCVSQTNITPSTSYVALPPAQIRVSFNSSADVFPAGIQPSRVVIHPNAKTPVTIGDQPLENLAVVLLSATSLGPSPPTPIPPLLPVFGSNVFAWTSLLGVGFGQTAVADAGATNVARHQKAFNVGGHTQTELTLSESGGVICERDGGVPFIASSGSSHRVAAIAGVPPNNCQDTTMKALRLDPYFTWLQRAVENPDQAATQAIQNPGPLRQCDGIPGAGQPLEDPCPIGPAQRPQDGMPAPVPGCTPANMSFCLASYFGWASCCNREGGGSRWQNIDGRVNLISDSCEYWTEGPGAAHCPFPPGANLINDCWKSLGYTACHDLGNGSSYWLLPDGRTVVAPGDCGTWNNRCDHRKFCPGANAYYRVWDQQCLSCGGETRVVPKTDRCLSCGTETRIASPNESCLACGSQSSIVDGNGRCCNGQIVNIRDDNNHCGACNNSCSATGGTCANSSCHCASAGVYDPTVTECHQCGTQHVVAWLGVGRCWQCGDKIAYGPKNQEITCCQNNSGSQSYMCGGEYACCPYEEGNKVVCVPRSSVSYGTSQSSSSCYVSPMP